MCSMWLRAVFGEITRRVEISLLDSPRRQQAEHLHLAGRQPRRSVPASADAVPGRHERGVDGIRVESPGSDLGPQLGGGGAGRQRRPVRARLAHRLVGIDGAQDTRRPGDRRAGQAARIARAVEAFPVLDRQAPSGASALDCWSIRPVRYGCIRTRSHSPTASGPALSQMPFDTPSRPNPWTRPARLRVRTSPSSSPSSAPGRGSQFGDGPGVAERERRLEIDVVGDRQQCRVELVIRQHDRQRRLGVDDRRPGPHRVEAAEDRQRRRR